MYKFIIPSYKRPLIIKDKTLTLLKSLGVSIDEIEIVVENDAMKEEYLAVLGEMYRYNIVVSNTYGIQGKRNFIREYYQFQTDYDYIICIDDDIDQLYNWDTPITPSEFRDMIEDAFIKCELEGLRMWGVSPFHNTFYMKKYDTSSLKYICGAFFGLIIDRDYAPILTDFNHYEDFDFTCSHFLRDKGVLRKNYISIKTKYFNPNGGITEWYGGKEQRKVAQEQDALRFVTKYPGMAKIIKKNYGTDLRLNHNFKITQ